jgi:hypothetical protein
MATTDLHHSQHHAPGASSQPAVGAGDPAYRRRRQRQGRRRKIHREHQSGARATAARGSRRAGRRRYKLPVYLKLHFAPGECAQMDWGAFGTVVGNTRRRRATFIDVHSNPSHIRRVKTFGQLGPPHVLSRKGQFFAFPAQAKRVCWTLSS